MKRMNTILLIKVFLRTSLAIGIIFISACFDTDTQSIDQGPSALDVDVNVEAGTLMLRASPKISSVELDWDEVEGAVDYQVSYKLNNESETLTLTDGASHFTFSAIEASTYYVSVAALNGNLQTLSKSKVIKIVTGSSAALNKSDVGL